MYRPSFRINHTRILSKENNYQMLDFHEEIYQYERSLLKPNYIYSVKINEISYMEKTSGDQAHIDNIEKTLLKDEIGFLIQECSENYVILDLFNADKYEVRVGDILTDTRRNIKVFVNENLHIALDNKSNPNNAIIITPSYINEIELTYN